jgi:hypothetical protein
MKLYADSSLELTEAIKLQKSFDDESFIIEKIIDIKADHCLIKWLGFTDAENSWEPIQVIQEDAPKLLEAFQLEQKTARGCDTSASDAPAKRRRRR